MTSPVRFENGGSLPLDDLPHVSLPDFHASLLRWVSQGARVVALFGVREATLRAAASDETALRLIALVARDEAGTVHMTSATVTDAFDSLTPHLPQVQRFEREIHEQWGAQPTGHPWLKPVRSEDPRWPRPGHVPRARHVGQTDFFRVAGNEIHEVAVGPVHAGIIEPGHFRFQCHGEHVYHLEIALGYQHRGVERAMVGGPSPRTRHYAETLAGDTTIGHAFAHAVALESLAGVGAPPRARRVRGLALELERIANHVGDLGAMAGDIGYLPTASFCGGLRGDFLNMTAMLCGNRFGRDMVVPGGVLAPDDAVWPRLAEKVASIEAAVHHAVELLWSAPMVLDRMAGAGIVSRELAAKMGFVGVAARATGLARDVRHDFPLEPEMKDALPVATASSGDVHARALVRWKEVQTSMSHVRSHAHPFPPGPSSVALPALRPRRLAFALVEGWRGEICHVAITDEGGRLAHYKVVDPSFHNWAALAHAMRDQPISDFPLCNKSFNLSYCGQDL